MRSPNSYAMDVKYPEFFKFTWSLAMPKCYAPLSCNLQTYKSKAQEAAPLGGRSSRSIWIKMGENHLNKHIISQSVKQQTNKRTNK